LLEYGEFRLAAVAQSVEYRDAIFAADDDFAVNEAGTASKSLWRRQSLESA
jgi:hypothetical protein